MRSRDVSISVMLLCLLTTSCVSLPGSGSRFPTPVPARTITSSSPVIREVWRRRVGVSFSGALRYSMPLATFSADLVILPVSGQTKTQLVALRARDGEQVWSRTIENPGFSDVPITVDSVFADARRVYVAVPFKVLAFDLRDGRPVWSTQELPSHARYEILPILQDHTFQVYSRRQTTQVYNVNADNGKIQSVDEYSGTLVLRTPTTEYHTAPPNGLFRIDSQTKQVLWQAPIKERVWAWPTIVNSELMLFTVGFYPTSLKAVNAGSGKLLWETPSDRVSNLVVVNDRVYSLRKDAALVAQEVRTGREIEFVRFGDRPLSTEHSGYWVLAAPPMLFVYLLDSQELVAFGP